MCKTNIICRSRKFFSKLALINLYNILFIYIKLQNKIIRIITNSHFLASSEKLYNETGILPFVTLVKYQIVLLIFKIAKHTVTYLLLVTSGCSAASNWQPGPHAVSTIVCSSWNPGCC